MFDWFSPFELPSAITDQLRDAGGTPRDPATAPQEREPRPLALIYLPPDTALLPPEQLRAAYDQILASAPEGELWHVARLTALCRLAVDGHPSDPSGSQPNLSPGNYQAIVTRQLPSDFELPSPDTVRALVALEYCRDYPALLDRYLDLELTSNLAGTKPDLQYKDRLRSCYSIDTLLATLNDKELERQLEDAVRRADVAEQQAQTATHTWQQCLNDLQASKAMFAEKEHDNHQLSIQIQNLSVELQAKNDELKRLQSSIAELQELLRSGEAKEQDLGQQLRFSSEQLEQYFHESQQGQQLAAAQAKQIKRAALLLQRTALLKGINVSKLPFASIQLLALLEGYRHSLKRAERLLGGGGGGN